MRVISAGFLLVLLPCSAASARDLSFEERVHAQEAIERVYYSHQIGATKAFEAAVPRAVIEKKVETYLEESAALASFWNTPVTAAMLRAEMRHQASATQMPDRLRELYAALGDDAFLVEECLVRPALVDRLARSFFESDERIHGLRKRTWSSWWREASPGFDRAVGVSAAPDDVLPPLEEAPGCGHDNTWKNGVLDDVPHARSGQSAVWTGNEVIVFGGYGEFGAVTEGERYDPAIDRWSPISSVGEPIPLSYHSAVWTGTEMIVWGGPVSGGAGRYDPVADAWSPVSTDGAPSGRSFQTAIWTGSRMVVWGGLGIFPLQSGGQYDPATDTWSATSLVGAPATRYGHVAVWTGKRMLVWGGYSQGYHPETGGSYDPVEDVWTSMSAAGAPQGREGSAGVWAGAFLVVWGGYAGFDGDLDTGGRYDPESDTWLPTSLAGAPSARIDFTAISTGDRMLVWGGRSDLDGAMNTGGRYDPVSDTWTSMSLTNAPVGRAAHEAVWTGSRMIVTGGTTSYLYGFKAPTMGGRYDPVTDTWTPTSTWSGPRERSNHSQVWTGSKMIVWGGVSEESFHGVFLVTGGMYDPALDTWTDTSTDGAPGGREEHATVWTGTDMIVWGGVYYDGTTRYWNDGGRYDPVADAWTPVSTVGAPAGRSRATGVWTGSEMIVWGGSVLTANYGDGGRYSPATDTWTPVSLTGAPAARNSHTAVWTGSEMIVWGGWGDQPFGDGERYDPTIDAWTPVSANGAPGPRAAHTAVWTGSRMIVWGGTKKQRLQGLQTGGIYDLATDSWTPISTVNVPRGRSFHTAVWTGSEMIVWGGIATMDYLQSGARYDPEADAWRSTRKEDAPSPRWNHRAVWTGEFMIVWGGDYYGNYTSTGGAYHACP